MTEQGEQREQTSGPVRDMLVARADKVSVPDGWADRVLGDGRRVVGRRRFAAAAAAVAAVAAVAVAVPLSGLPTSDAQPPASSRPEWAVRDSVPKELRKLPMGPDTQVPYGTGGGDGETSRQVMLGGKVFSVPDKYDGFRIWRAGDRGFVYLAQESSSVTVVAYVDADGSTKELERTADGQHTTQLNVSADGRFAAWTVHPTEGRSVVVKRADLTTGKVDSRTYEGVDSVYGFAGHDVLVEWNGLIQNVGSLDQDKTAWPSADLNKHQAGLSIVGDSVLLRVPNDCLRSYALSQSEKQRWELCDETGEMRFSPDGRRIADARGDGSLVVHDASSGEVTAELRAASRVHVQGMVWESDDQLLLGLAEQEWPEGYGNGKKVSLVALPYGPTYLVRCHVKRESCELVDTGGSITAFPGSAS
ncbi:hypothetical protein [Streptomyces dysideae]|uniref:WD40 repeat domain-containing protein n=1 Tax=Streptomyces dysideae TaxID=909626 RepID=A0A101V4Q9_9ACTN|nr:hypothetical protein [Streptomyces dysideae]KUO22480.1 hypothetical protein AQJ91_03320 [Streptomyces dysideae]